VPLHLWLMDLRTFKPIGRISIQQVLTRIRYNPDGEPFSIGFCRATSDGKADPKGQIVYYDKALQGAPPKFIQRNGSKGFAERAELAATPRNFRTEGTVPIHNYESKEFKTPLIASIMFFEGKLVKHASDGDNND
jgi:hypothetical protein